MPELPDVETYLACLRPRVLGEPLEGARIRSFFLVRTVEPPVSAAVGRRVAGLSRLGKRIVFEFEGELFFVLHLMLAGRLRWRPPEAPLPGKFALAGFDFPRGTLLVTEAGTKRRASLHVVAGRAGLAAHDPGGIEPLSATAGEFAAAIRRENHTVKRALTDPRLVAGIGNAFSDEILHRARLSPFVQTAKLTPEDLEALHAAVREVLAGWTARLIAEAGDGFPEKVVAAKEGLSVHGRFGKPCPVCGAPVQRIVYAENETNYCPGCQTGGRILADRALSRLLKDDWPGSLDDL